MYFIFKGYKQKKILNKKNELKKRNKYGERNKI